MELSARASRGGLQVIAGQWLRYVLQIVSVIILARLLPPSQYGLVGMITAIVGVAEVIRDFGLSNAAMREISLDPQQISALFWLNTGVGALCTIIVAAGAPLIGDFYHRSDLVSLTVVLSFIFVINGASAQFQANLARHLLFGRTAIADGVSMAVGVGVGLSVALYSPTAWALVLMNLSAAVVRLVILIASQPFVPGRFRGARIRSMLGFGGNITVVQLLDYASRNLDTILVGRYWGPYQVGLYNNAYQLLLLPLQQINAPLTRVALPVLARLQGDRKRYEDYLTSALMTISYATTILYSVLAALATDIIVVLLGHKWAAAGPIFQAMCLAGVLQALNYVSYWQFMALNRTGVQLRYSLLTKPIVLIGFLIAAPHGVTDVAWSYTITTAMVVPGGFYFACRGTGIDARRLLTCAVRPLPVGVFMFLCLWSAQHYLSVGGPFLQLLTFLPLSLVVLGVVALVSGSYRRDFIKVSRLVLSGARR